MGSPLIKKIDADLVELTTPADGDILVIVDVSEALDVDKTKKISFLNLLASKISKSLFTAAGDILYATASATLAILAKPSVDSVLQNTSAGTLSWKALTTFVSQIIAKRQGNAADTDWSHVGNTNYTPPTSSKIQVGGNVVNVSTANGSCYMDYVTVTFPVAFTYPPLVVVGLGDNAGTGIMSQVHVLNITTTTCRIYVKTSALPTPDSFQEVYWIAIGE